MARKTLHGKALVAQLRAQAGVRDPEALAAYLGRYKKARKAGLKPGAAKKMAHSGQPTRTSKLASSVKVSDRELRPIVDSALKAFDSVFMLPSSPRMKRSADAMPITLVGGDTRGGDDNGNYTPGERGITLSRRLLGRPDHARLTATHELAHWIDNAHLSSRESGRFESAGGKNLRETRKAIKESARYKQWTDKKRQKFAPRALADKDKWASRPEEAFAQALTQYVATRPGSPLAATWRRERAKQPAEDLNNEVGRTWWPADEFGVIAEAIEQDFGRLGLLRKAKGA